MAAALAAAGCVRRTCHSRSVGRPGFARIIAGTCSLPTSWISAAQLSRSRSGCESPISSPNITEYARTRSEWPRVMRSCLPNSATRPSRCSADACADPVSTTRLASPRALPLRRATENRDGASSGNTNVSRKSVLSGARCSVIRCTTRAPAADTATMSATQATVIPNPSGRSTSRLDAATVTNPPASGPTNMAKRRPRPGRPGARVERCCLRRGGSAGRGGRLGNHVSGIGCSDRD